MATAHSTAHYCASEQFKKSLMAHLAAAKKNELNNREAKGARNEAPPIADIIADRNKDILP